MRKMSVKGSGTYRKKCFEEREEKGVFRVSRGCTIIVKRLTKKFRRGGLLARESLKKRGITRAML